MGTDVQDYHANMPGTDFCPAKVSHVGSSTQNGVVTYAGIFSYPSDSPHPRNMSGIETSIHVGKVLKPDVVSNVISQDGPKSMAYAGHSIGASESGAGNAAEVGCARIVLGPDGRALQTFY